MHRLVRSAVATAAWMALTVLVTVASAENDADKAEPPPAKPSTPSTTNPPQPPATPEITVLAKHEVEGILGRDVRSAADEDMGRIVDVLVDRAGQVRAAIIDFGGFLGVGSRKIAVDWSALHFPEPGKPGQRITLELNRDQVNTAPEYKDGKPVVVLGALGKLEPLPE
jgi:PRC-barrel domain